MLRTSLLGLVLLVVNGYLDPLSLALGFEIGRLVVDSNSRKPSRRLEIQ